MTDANTLKSQYSAQVEADLERNAKEQERITAEVAALQEQLRTLDHDRTLLVGMREALSVPGAAPVAEETPAAALPKARKPKDESAAPKQRAKKAAAGKKAAPAKKAPAAAQPRQAGTPTLRELVLTLLTASTEPRSAAEVTTTLGESHPERKAGGTVVRNTLESLVARGQAERTKQNKSVFYTALPAAAKDSGKDTSKDTVEEAATAGA
ncbi:hypothetical protein EOT10_22500 [Streptomyces antnestii]|uniref:Uncharacterized protein n=1 Tax=Streptomyces antnestii TaxID=2494256 RepID=A0A437PJ36_9ACTN|nr:hypothetical protein [Streptomyces sp. San01]RVU22227.1 hypothetical protein EOT10_22500 [Streptomyces sp. San01]